MTAERADGLSNQCYFQVTEASEAAGPSCSPLSAAALPGSAPPAAESAAAEAAGASRSGGQAGVPGASEGAEAAVADPGSSWKTASEAAGAPGIREQAADSAASGPSCSRKAASESGAPGIGGPAADPAAAEAAVAAAPSFMPADSGRSGGPLGASGSDWKLGLLMQPEELPQLPLQQRDKGKEPAGARGSGESTAAIAPEVSLVHFLVMWKFHSCQSNGSSNSKID